MEKLKYYTISANTGLDAIKGAPITLENTGLKCLRIGDISNGKVYSQWGNSIVTENNLKRFALKKNDIIVARTGNTIGVNKIIEKDYLNTVFNNGLIRIRVDENICDAKFIYYNLQTKKFKDFISGIAFGTSTQPNMKIEDLLKFDIPKLKKEQQKKIASILSSLDDKIELNNEMNKTLEEMAQTLFKQWFVDFEFPNENGEPYKSSGGKMVESEFGLIPEGWEVKSLDEIANMHNGYSYKGSELQKSKDGLLTIKNFDRNGGFKINGYKELKSEKVKENHYAEIGDVIVSHTDLTQNAEIIGNPIIILSKDKYEKIIVSMDCVKVVSKHIEISGYLLYLFLKDKRFKNHALGYVSGTTVLHLKKEALPKYKIAVPINKILESFSFLVENIKNKMVVQYNETERLIETRNLILPKLMSGKLEG